MICRYCKMPLLTREPWPDEPDGPRPIVTVTDKINCGICGAAYEVETREVSTTTLTPAELERIRNIHR